MIYKPFYALIIYLLNTINLAVICIFELELMLKTMDANCQV